MGCRLPDVSRLAPSTSNLSLLPPADGRPNLDQASRPPLIRSGLSRLTRKPHLALVQSPDASTRLRSNQSHHILNTEIYNRSVVIIEVWVAVCAGCLAMASFFGITAAMPIDTPYTIAVIVLLTIVVYSVTGGVVAEVLIRRSDRRLRLVSSAACLQQSQRYSVQTLIDQSRNLVD